MVKYSSTVTLVTTASRCGACCSLVSRNVDLTREPGYLQRKTGYVQQQDLHLETATVREALQFSAILRQPKHVPREEKLAYAEEILVLLGMDKYADAVVGVAGEGLNVEERKRLSIGRSLFVPQGATELFDPDACSCVSGVEMVAKPELLLFLDEPSRSVQLASLKPL